MLNGKFNIIPKIFTARAKHRRCCSLKRNPYLRNACVYGDETPTEAHFRLD